MKHSKNHHSTIKWKNFFLCIPSKMIYKTKKPFSSGESDSNDSTEMMQNSGKRQEKYEWSLLWVCFVNDGMCEISRSFVSFVNSAIRRNDIRFIQYIDLKLSVDDSDESDNQMNEISSLWLIILHFRTAGSGNSSQQPNMQNRSILEMLWMKVIYLI